jgi:hypothetical protein
VPVRLVRDTLIIAEMLTLIVVGARFVIVGVTGLRQSVQEMKRLRAAHRG